MTDEYAIYNVLRFRGKLSKKQFSQVLNCLDSYLKLFGADATGGAITAIHTMYLDTRRADIEIFVPINMTVPSDNRFTYMPKLIIRDCMLIKFSGSSHLIPKAYTDFYYEAKKMGYNIKLPFYNVFCKDAVNPWILQDIDMVIYASVEEAPKECLGKVINFN